MLKPVLGWTSHHSIVEYKGKWYLFYHDVQFKVTSYPQAIGMAATWDTLSLQQMAHFSALEGRIVFNKATALGRNNERYLGLTYWTPNINIFRDPRWGRGQETYGEDPFLTAMLGRAFVHGLQGDDPKYLKAAACAKHFAVHSGVEVVYEKAVDFTRDNLLRYADVSDQFSWENEKGFKAEYFNNKDLSGSPVWVRIESQLANRWQEGQ